MKKISAILCMLLIAVTVFCGCSCSVAPTPTVKPTETMIVDESPDVTGTPNAEKPDVTGDLGDDAAPRVNNMPKAK